MNFNVPENYYKLYSPYCQSIQVIKFLKYYKKDLSKLLITDSTGGIGGNSYVFCKFFGYVNIIEKDKVAIEYISTNLSEFNNKSMINIDYTHIFLSLKQDIIFIDPPWGDNYKNNNNIKLYIGEYNIHDIINNLYNNAQIIILKAPNNYKINKCNNWKPVVHQVYISNKHLYNLIFYLK